MDFLISREKIDKIIILFREKFWQALPASDRVFPQSSIITLPPFPLYYCNIVVCIRIL